MKYLEVAHGLRLRPSHVLLMIYRYTSGVYQIGDLSTLNYIKGYLDGRGTGGRVRNVLTVSGHGIGEAESWLVERFPACHVDALSFRMVDTQLLHFLRVATEEDIHSLFAGFEEMVAGLHMLEELVADPGLVPYWCEQAHAHAGTFASGGLSVFSDSPLRIPGGRLYDLIYVSQAAPYFSPDAAERLRARLLPGGLLAALVPAHNGEGERARFAQSALVAEAKRLARSLFHARGYTIDLDGKPQSDLAALSARREPIRFSVLAPAGAVLIGELILSSLGEHISDHDRLEVLNETAARFHDVQTPVTEELEVYVMEAGR